MERKEYWFCREKRMLPSAAVNDLTMTPTKIPRLNQTKATIDQGHAPEKPTTPVSDDDRDETASNTSVAVGWIEIYFFWIELLFVF